MISYIFIPKSLIKFAYRLDQNCIKNITCSKVQISYKLQKDCLFYINLVFNFVLENLRSESQDLNIIELWKKKCIRCINMEANNKIYFGIFWKLWKKIYNKKFWQKKWALVKTADFVFRLPAKRTKFTSPWNYGSSWKTTNPYKIYNRLQVYI